MSEDDICHGREVAIKQTHNFFRRCMFGDTRKPANVREEYRDGLTDATKLERFRIFQHLLDYIFRKKPAVICPRYFLAGESLVGPGILNSDCRLCRDRANQLEVVGFEGRKGIQTV